MAKICKVIFSTNRLEYLTRSLESQKNLNWGDNEVHGIFFDDFPKGRNDELVNMLVNLYGYNEVYLHPVNQGLSATWAEFWNLIRDRDYDYVYHQEDDIEILQPVKIDDLIFLLNADQVLSQIVLQRQKWYIYDEEPKAEPTDWTFLNYRYTRHSVLFSPMASFYPISRVRVDYSSFLKEKYPEENWWQVNPNEGMIGKVLLESQGLLSSCLKTQEGKNLVNHIGEYFVGKRVLPNEPCYELFERFDPEKKYYSHNGDEYDK